MSTSYGSLTRVGVTAAFAALCFILSPVPFMSVFAVATIGFLLGPTPRKTAYPYFATDGALGIAAGGLPIWLAHCMGTGEVISIASLPPPLLSAIYLGGFGISRLIAWLQAK